MSSNLIANRYAKALIKILDFNQNGAERALSYLAAADELFENPDSRRVLKSPVMPEDLKLALLCYAAEKTNSGAEFSAFSKQIVDAGRTGLMPEIGIAFRKLLDAKRGVATATATTAQPMEQSAISELASVLTDVFKKKVTVTNKTDEEVLGGLLVQVGNFNIDMSLKTRLNSVANHAQR